MLKKRHQFLIKKGLRVLLTNPKTFYYKYQQYANTSNKKLAYFDHNSIYTTDYIVPVLSFSPDIIIPIYNGYELLVKLLGQLLTHIHIKYHLILIDDCSYDEKIAPYLKSLQKTNTFHTISIITNTTNLGFVESVNRGMKLVKNHFIILNTDTEVPTYFVNKILQPILDDNKVASVTPFTNSGAICSFPEFLADNPLFMGLDIEILDSTFGRIDPSHNFEIPTGVGFCMAMNKNVYDVIGSFTTKIFGKGYGEENDWCMRAYKAGYKNIHAVNCFVYHKHGGSFNADEKHALIANNIKKLDKIHPQYIKIRHKFFAKDPASDLRIFMQLCLVTDNINTTCILNSVYTGGSVAYLKGFIQAILDSAEAVLLISSQDFTNKCNLSLYYKDQILEFSVNNVFTLLRRLKFYKVIVNHLLFEPKIMMVSDAIIEIKKYLNVQLDIILHDYFFLCPSTNLLNYNNHYCELPNENECRHCLSDFSNRSISNEYIKLYSPSSIASWREPLTKLLDFANKVWVPSKTVSDLALKVYPFLEQKIELIQQDLSYLNHISNKLNYKIFSKAKITIMTIGNITKHKGSKVIYELYKYVQQQRLNIEFVILGNIDPYHRLKKLTLHRNYKPEDLSRLLNKYQPDILILPSIWPETFCYTASEMLHFNLPLISFNLGAHALRIRQSNNGYIVNEVTSIAMFDMILNVIRQYSSITNYTA